MGQQLVVDMALCPLNGSQGPINHNYFSLSHFNQTSPVQFSLTRSQELAGSLPELPFAQADGALFWGREEHALVKDPLKGHDRPVDFNVITYKKFTDMNSNFTLELTLCEN